MSAVQTVSVEQYLRTAYEHDPELINGELKERPMPTKMHAFVQMLIGAWFIQHMEDWGIMPLSEVRTRVTFSDFRLPDVAVARREPIRGKTQDEPPLIAIEILSPDDRFSDLHKRALDFSRMGVEHIWLIDPEEQVAFLWGGDREKSWLSTERLAVDGTPIHLDLHWVWSKIPHE